MLIIKAIRLSGRPTAKVVDVNGRKFNLTTEKDPSRKPRLFVVVDLEDADNPFAPMRSRAITQQYNSTTGEPMWKIPIDRIFGALGQKVPGDFITLKTLPYKIREDSKPATSYTAVVFPHEQPETVFLNAGRVPEGRTEADLPPRFLIASTTGEALPLTEDEITAKPEAALGAGGKLN